MGKKREGKYQLTVADVLKWVERREREGEGESREEEGRGRFRDERDGRERGGRECKGGGRFREERERFGEG